MRGNKVGQSAKAMLLGGTSTMWMSISSSAHLIRPSATFSPSDAERGIRKFTAHEDVRPTGRVPVTTGSVSNWDRAVLFQGVRRMRRAEREGLRVLPHRLKSLPDHLRMLPGRLRALPLRLNGIRECLRTVPAGLSGDHPRL